MIGGIAHRRHAARHVAIRGRAYLHAPHHRRRIGGADTRRCCCRWPSPILVTRMSRPHDMSAADHEPGVRPSARARRHGGHPDRARHHPRHAELRVPRHGGRTAPQAPSPPSSAATPRRLPQPRRPSPSPRRASSASCPGTMSKPSMPWDSRWATGLIPLVDRAQGGELHGPHQGRAQEAVAGARLPGAARAHPRQPRARSRTPTASPCSARRSANPRSSPTASSPSIPARSRARCPDPRPRTRHSASMRCGSSKTRRDQAQAQGYTVVDAEQRHRHPPEPLAAIARARAPRPRGSAAASRTVSARARRSWSRIWCRRSCP